MLSIFFTLLILPYITFAELRIEIYVDKNKSEAFIWTEGEINEIIPEEERNLWNLGDSELKHAAEIYSYGRPEEVFLRSPNLSEDPYESKYWRQVNRTLAPVAARIKSITVVPGINLKQSYTNTNNFTVYYPFKFSFEIEQTVSSSWTVVGHRLTLGNGINYNVYFKFGMFDAEDPHKFSFTSAWGVKKINIKKHSVGIKGGHNKKEVPAGHKVTASISIKQYIMEVKVDYRATLKGDVACRYPGETPNIRYYPVNSVLTEVGSPTEMLSTEVIRIGFISDASINVIDEMTSSILYEDAAIVN